LEDMDVVFLSSKSYLEVVSIAKSMPHASILAMDNPALQKQEVLNTPSDGSERKAVTTHFEETNTDKVQTP
jgi:hypothetical protein